MADLILILVLFLFVYTGYRKGFAKTLINASANVISIVCSFILTNPVANLIRKSPIGTAVRNISLSSIEKTQKLPPSAAVIAADGICFVISSIISFILIAIVVRIAVSVIAHTVDIVAKLPVIKQANRALGAVIGGISGFLICYVVIGFIFALSYSGAAELAGIAQSIENSILCSIIYYNNIIGNTISSVL